MSDQQQFEVYPPAAEAGPAPTETVTPHAATPTWEQPGAASTTPAAYPVTTYRAPQVPPPSGGPDPSRRGVIGLIVGVPLAGFILAQWSRAGERDAGDPWADGTVADDPTDDGGQADTGSSIDIGAYTLEVPDGWSAQWLDSGEVALTNGSNRLQVLNFTANEGDAATDLVDRLVKRRLKASKFTGTLGSTVDQSDGVDRALVKAAGKVGKKKATLIGQLWIDDLGDALLLLRVLTAKDGSPAADEAQSMVDDLDGQFA